MRYQMFNYKSLLFLAVTIFLAGVTAFIVPGLGSNGIANAQGGFTNESFQGTYAVTFTVGANNAAGLGIITADGNGNATGSGLFNVPVPIRKREVIAPLGFTVETEVNADGTSTGITTTIFPDGTIMESEHDFVITKAEVQDNGVKLATEIIILLREPPPFPLRGLVTIVNKRLPD